MVSIGCAIFVIGGLGIAADQEQAVTRVIQGVASGIGFLGAGTILKLSDKQEIKGLTTASSIWLTAALGITAGLGQHSLACAAFVVSMVVLVFLRPVESFLTKHHKKRGRLDPSSDKGMPP